MVKNNVFAEKYRPKTFDEVVGQEHIIPTLRAFVKNKKLPHILFSGKAGTGKTTLVKVIARELYGENWKQHFLEINASDDRGIEVVREKIKGYARIKTLGEDFKIIFLDEADAMCLTGDTEIIVGSLKNPTTRRLDSMIRGRKIMIPSVNPETLELESDKGWLVDSGYTDFLKVTLEDGSTINASKSHPFFKIKDGKLSRIKLEDLDEGDEIVELNDKIYNKCKVCGAYTFNKNCCSINCQNKYHSLEMSSKGNSMYGKHHTKETKQEISKILSDGRFAGKNNPNYEGNWYGKQFWDTATDEQKRQTIERLTKENSKSYEERFGERSLEERIKRNPSASRQRILTNDWIEKQLKEEHIKCQRCRRLVKTSGNEKDSIYIHHKDGNHDNHIPENIEFVCPYCHNMRCHDAKSRFLEKGWSKLRGVSVHNGIRIKEIKDIGKQKAWNISMERNKNFILKNGVVTHNTKDAQQALRRIIEMYSSKCRFALSCVTPDTKIVLPDEVEITIDDYMKNFDSGIVDKIQNFDKSLLKNDSVVRTIKLNPRTIGRKVLEIETMTGRKLKLTEDHKLLTINGWVEAGKLKETDKIFVYPNLEGTYFESNNNKIVNVDKFIKFLSKVEEKNGYKHLTLASEYRELKTLDKKVIMDRIYELKQYINTGVGLTKREYDIYQIIEKSPNSSVKDIQKLSGLSLARTRQLFQSIKNKGFVVRSYVKNHFFHFVVSGKEPMILRNLMDVKNIIEKEYNIKMSYKAVRNVFDDEISHRQIDRVITELKDNSLLDLTYSSRQIGALARIVGFISGDGHLIGNDKGVVFTGNVSLTNVKKDLKILGYTGLKITTKGTSSELRGRMVIGKTTWFTLNSKAFSLLLQYLGVSKGDKVSTCYAVPDFIRNGTKFVKREFLRALFGCDGDKPSSNRYNFNAINLRQNKIKPLKNNMLEFYQQLEQLLEVFGVESYINIRDKKEKRKKDLQEVLTFELTIRPSDKNTYRFLNRVGYAYKDYKVRLSKLASEYLRHKFFVIEQQKEKIKMIKKEVNNGKSYRKIARSIDCSVDFVVARLKGKDVHVSRKTFLKFDEWVDKYESGFFIENEIIKIRQIECNDVRDVTCSNNHNFISNGFISHNCNYPNKIINPIKDRCVLFRFRGIKPENMEPMLTKIAEKEQIDITPSAIHVLALLSKGSMRTALNTLDRLKSGEETGIDDCKIYDVMAYVNDDDIRALLLFVRQGDNESASECVDDLLNTKVYTSEEILESLWRLISGSTILSKESRLDALERLGDVEFRISTGSMPFFQLRAFCIRLIRLYNKSVVVK